MKELFIDQIELDKQFLLEHERDPVWTGERVQRLILSQQAVDVVRVVRCKDCWAFNEHNSKKMAEQGFGYCMAHGSCTPVTMRDWFCRNGDSEKPYVR